MGETWKTPRRVLLTLEPSKWSGGRAGGLTDKQRWCDEAGEPQCVGRREIEMGLEGKAKQEQIGIKTTSCSDVIDKFMWGDLHHIAMWPWLLGITRADGWSVWFCTLIGSRRRHLLVCVCVCFVVIAYERVFVWGVSILHARSSGTEKTY